MGALAKGEESCREATAAFFVTKTCLRPLGPVREISLKPQSQEEEFLEELIHFLSCRQ